MSAHIYCYYYYCYGNNMQKKKTEQLFFLTLVHVNINIYSTKLCYKKNLKFKHLCGIENIILGIIIFRLIFGIVQWEFSHFNNEARLHLQLYF